ncbi:class I adenylate-forming enzyme family protein [Saccharothrix sp. BKS2]|uniref:class I adenylate-forming enzyme family protein n=1 Tax=Saccharothrix sp. BKS2 TaxID=3064400 RepID=UPI0039ED50AE
MKPHDLGTLFDEVASRRPHTTVHLDRPFDIAPGDGPGAVEHTVPELAWLVREAAGWLHAAGLRRGERVAVVKRNHYDYALLACAAIRLGAVPALISGRLPDDVLEVLLKRLEPALLVTDRRPPADAARRVLSLDPAVEGALTLDDVRGQGVPAPRRRHDDEPLVIHHTSGTTGVPKLVVHTTRTLAHRPSRVGVARWPVIGARRDDVVANGASYAHVRAFRWTAGVFRRAPREVVLLSEAGSAERVFTQHPPTTLEALPAAYARWRPLAARPDNPFHDVRLFVSAYDAVHPPVVRTMLHASRRRWPVWVQGWGQSETGPLTSRFLTRRAVNRPFDARDLGRPVPGRTRLRVVDPDTLEPVPRGRAGLLLARTAARCPGYVGEQDRWLAKTSGAWWHTGDLGVLTRGGAVRLLDREVDAVPGLSCLEVEDLLEDRLPEVVECVVLGAPGGPPVPVLVLDGPLDPPAWRRAVADLPPLAAPHVLAWDEVPRTVTGKVRRLDLLIRLTGAAEIHGSGRWT